MASNLRYVLGMSEECLGYERSGAVAVVTIDDAPHNRMSVAFMDAFEPLVATIASDATIRAVVMTAAGEQNFSVGMNLKELAGSLGHPGRVDVILDQRLRVLAAIENMDKPWIATLFGNCLGGGLELPLACHCVHAEAQAGLRRRLTRGVASTSRPSVQSVRTRAYVTPFSSRYRYRVARLTPRYWRCPCPRGRRPPSSWRWR